MMHRPIRYVAAAALIAAVSLALPFTGAQMAPESGPAAPAAAAKRPAPANQLRFATERVVVFKDGYALVVKSATATADAQGRVFTPDVPDSAILGCFWALGDGVKLQAMKSEWLDSRDVRKTPAPALTMRELLRANVGRKVTVTCGGGGVGEDKARTVTGTIAELLEAPANPDTRLVAQPSGSAGLITVEPAHRRSPFEEAAATLAPGSRAIYNPDYGSSASPLESVASITRELPPRGGEYVVLDGTESGRLVLPVGQVRSLGGDELRTQVNREEEVLSHAKRLSFDFGADHAGKPIALHTFYFTPGIRWIPTYRVTGELKDKADLSLQAEVINELEDIDHAALDLVVGVPNFRFKDTLSPLTLERTMRNALASAAPTLLRNNDYNGQLLNSQFANSNMFVSDRPAPAVAPVAPELAGNGGEQDLFVYGLKDFSLANGARATLPLWENSAPLRHLYTYDLQTRRSRSTGGKIDAVTALRNAGNSPLQVTLNRIWHQLELTNDTNVPWTTGAALMLKGNLPLGQDMLTYTSPGAATLLPVTVAVDLRGTSDEQEVERHNGALNLDGNTYALVKKQGTITVNNYRKEKSDMRISLSTGGKVESASDKGKIKLNEFRPEDWDDSSYMRPNNHSDVTWEFTLDPGASKTITYTLSSYVR